MNFLVTNLTSSAEKHDYQYLSFVNLTVIDIIKSSENYFKHNCVGNPAEIYCLHEYVFRLDTRENLGVKKCDFVFRVMIHVRNSLRTEWAKRLFYLFKPKNISLIGPDSKFFRNNGDIFGIIFIVISTIFRNR